MTLHGIYLNQLNVFRILHKATTEAMKAFFVISLFSLRDKQKIHFNDSVLKSENFNAMCTRKKHFGD